MMEKHFEALVQKLAGFEHVIWDWNGTLLNDVDHAVQIMNGLLAEHTLPAITRERYQEIFEFPVRLYYEALGFDFAQESFESLCHRFVDRFMAGLHELPLVSGAEELIRDLNRQGIKQSVLSATDQHNLDRMITHFGLSNIFSYIYGIDNKMAGSKIERGQELLRLSAVEPHKTIIVGDTIHDLEVANALNVQAVLVGYGHQGTSKLSRFHDNIVCS